jgi:hypothetical protein
VAAAVVLSAGVVGVSNAAIVPMPRGPVVDGSVSEQVWQELRSQEWRGIAGDGQEAFYPLVLSVSWDEPNAAMPAGVEHLCGQLGLMPVSAFNVSLGCHA